MIRFRFLLLCVPLLSGCNAEFGGPPLVSGQSGANANAANTMPMPANSLPPGAEGLATGPNATAPDDASITLGLGL